jgi:hypothetical protein
MPQSRRPSVAICNVIDGVSLTRERRAVVQDQWRATNAILAIAGLQ